MAEEKEMTEIEWRRMCGEKEIQEEKMTEEEWRKSEEREIEEERMLQRPKFESRKIEAKSYESRRTLKGGYESIMIERKVVNYFSTERVAELLIAGELGAPEDYFTGTEWEDNPDRAAVEFAKGFAKEMAVDMHWSLGQPTPISCTSQMDRNWMRARSDYMMKGRYFKD